MRLKLVSALSCFLLAANCAAAAWQPARLRITAPELADKVKGALVGQLFGNLNGLPHEMKYIGEPGSVESYTPGLPDGAWTNDDTDIEWVYVVAMEDSGRLFLDPDHIVKLWKDHIVERTDFATGYSKRLMEIGIKPPLTGNMVLNPWADFNVAGQFLAETFGIIAPGLPKTAARLGLHYTTVCIDGEPAQLTQFVTSAVAMAFFESDINRLIDVGLASVDPASSFFEVARTTRNLVKENPADWRRTRLLLKQRYAKFGGELRDRNGFELNGSATIAALLYGKGDLAESLRMAFNFGWDADNSAASVGSILGAVKGYRWMEQQGWKVKDVYFNTNRLYMPLNETISGFADRLAALANKVLVVEGKAKVSQGPQGTIYEFERQSPASVLPSYPENVQRKWLQRQLDFEVDRILSSPGSEQDNARAVYFAVTAGSARSFQKKYPEQWNKAVRDFRSFPRLADLLIRSAERGLPAALALQERAKEAGIELVRLPR